MDCSQPSFICQKLRQSWSLKVILPCCFIALVLWISIVKWGLYLWTRVILKGLLGSQAIAFMPVFRMAWALYNCVSIIIHRGNALNILVSFGNCVEHTVYIHKTISSSCFHFKVFVSPHTVGIPITCFPALELNGNHSPGSVTLPGSLSTP